MIIGFGNNVVSSLAADITASQTTIQVMPGAGEMFAKLLTSDFVNTSNPLKVYAKITLTDAKETVFEVCHLTAVDGDMLTVVRGQEGTTAKGWSLNDVIANFATRGSENQFVQIEQLQSGQYTSGVAAGTANALTLALPANYFVNGSTDWVLRSPIVVYPVQNNTGAATLQLTLGGRVLGTFPLYKGNKAELVADDILKDTALVCLMDKTKTFFNVANPGAIYAGLGTAAFCDVQTSRDDVTPGRVLVTGSAIATRSVFASSSAGAFTDDANSLPGNSVSFVYASSKNSPGFEASVLDYAGLSGSYNTQFAASYAQPGKLRFRTKNGDIDQWNPWMDIITTTGGIITGKLRVDSGIGLGTDNVLGGNSIALGDNDTGFKQNGDGVLDVIANNVQSMRIIRDAVQVANWSGSWINMRDQRCFTGQQIVSDNSASAIVRQEHQDRHFCLGGLGNHQFGIYMINKARTENGTDGQAFLSVEGNFQCPSGQLIPGNYGNFDARYQAKGNYTPAGQAYTKSESDARYQLKNSASKAANGWHKDATTGIITQWGYVKKAGDRNAYITFPISFPSAVCSVVINIDGSPGWSPNLVQFVYNVSRTGCSVSAHDPDRNRGVYWMAIGY